MVTSAYMVYAGVEYKSAFYTKGHSDTVHPRGRDEITSIQHYRMAWAGQSPDTDSGPVQDGMDRSVSRQR